jgi:Resolvase, N terminal domain
VSACHVARERNAYGKPSNSSGTLRHPPNQSQSQSPRTPPATPPASAAGEPHLKHAAQYARVSTEKQEREDTVVSQVDLLCKAPTTLGYDLSPTSVFLDEGVSGIRLDRPALDRLRDLAAEGAFANRAMTLFTSLGTSADCRGQTQVPKHQV